MFNAISVTGSPAAGYSSGQAQGHEPAPLETGNEFLFHCYLFPVPPAGLSFCAGAGLGRGAAPQETGNEFLFHCYLFPVPPPHTRKTAGRVLFLRPAGRLLQAELPPHILLAFHRRHVAAALPHLQELVDRCPVHSLAAAHVLELFGGELLGEQGQEVTGTGAALPACSRLGIRYGLAEELHLAPQVVLLAPPDEVLQRLVPLPALRHIEHHGLEEGDDVAAEREILIHA